MVISRLYDFVQVKLRSSLVNVTTFLTYSDVQVAYVIRQIFNHNIQNMTFYLYL